MPPTCLRHASAMQDSSLSRVRGASRRARSCSSTSGCPPCTSHPRLCSQPTPTAGAAPTPTARGRQKLHPTQHSVRRPWCFQLFLVCAARSCYHATHLRVPCAVLTLALRVPARQASCSRQAIACPMRSRSMRYPEPLFRFKSRYLGVGESGAEPSS
eukprot:3289277-Rhodomonas_salina.1